MDHIKSVEFAPDLRRISTGLAWACLALGCVVLFGWGLDLPLLKSVRPGLPNMAVNTAVGLVLIGLALLARFRGTALGRNVCRVLGAILAGRGILKLVGYASSLDLELDQWIIQDTSPLQGSMAVLTAANFALTGAALLLLELRWRGWAPSEWLSIAVALLSMMALLGKVNNVPVPIFTGSFATVPLHTSIGFLICSMAVILADQGHAIATALADGGPSGVLARRLVPLSIFLPLFLGWLCLSGEQRGLYSTEVALTLLVLACIVCAVGFSLWAAVSTKNANRVLSTEQERLRVTLRSIGDGVIAVDLEMRVTMVNAVAEKLTGWPEGEARGRPLQEVFKIGGTALGGPMENPVMMALRNDERFEVKEPFVLIDRAGQEVMVADSSAPIHDAEEHLIGAVVIFRDVTLKQKSEKELLKLEKLESLAVLAGGIAHDWNNILGVILANVSLAAAEKGSAQMERLRDAEAAVVRGAQLSVQLMAFAKGSAAIRKTFAIGPVIEEAARFALTGRNGRVVFDLGDQAAVVDADPGQLSQLIQNLVLNASEAMPDGGLIHVSMRSVDLGERDGLPLAPGRYLRIVVKDSGQGIVPGVLEHIFEPFFSTKVKGNGLGLASAFNIAKAHQGHLMVATAQGHGSAFSFFLPASTKAVPEAAHKPARAVTGKGRILVMDDDADIMKVSLLMITSLGYRAQGAAEGTSAIAMLEKAQREGDPYVAAILDLTVPGAMGGREAVGKMLEIQPGLRTIVASGYSEDPILEQPGKYGFAAAISKPYSLHSMSEVLNGLNRERAVEEV